MNQNPFENKIPNQEQLPVKIELATEKDWKEYRELRLEAINSPDAEMLGFTPGIEESENRKKKEEAKTEEDWRKDLSNPEVFLLLLYKDSEVGGMFTANRRVNEGYWYMRSLYIREQFRDKDNGKKMYAACLEEIQRRGGERVRLRVKIHNGKSIHIAESFGFLKIEEDSTDFGFYMELDDVNNPEVQKKIDQILNAR